MGGHTFGYLLQHHAMYYIIKHEIRFPVNVKKVKNRQIIYKAECTNDLLRRNDWLKNINKFYRKFNKNGHTEWWRQTELQHCKPWFRINDLNILMRNLAEITLILISGFIDVPFVTPTDLIYIYF